MLCPNCRSSWIRRSKRNDAEKFFLPLIFLRPFRCEDCISRFYGWIWAEGSTSPERETGETLRTPLPSAALHSGFRRRSWRRKIEKRLTSDPWNFISESVSTWLKKPMQHSSSAQPTAAAQATMPAQKVAAASAGSSSSTAQAPFQPEILGFIPEVKREDNAN